MIPSVNTCLSLMQTYGMLENIRAHSLVVARIAWLLASGLREEGLPLSLERSVAGALLHDIGKTQALRLGGNHCAIGKTMCIEEGLEEIADLVEQHVVLQGPWREAEVSEAMLVYYADKRVNHDRVVTLEERLAYILGRYGGEDPLRHRAIHENFAQCREVEDRIFSLLPYGPGEVSLRIADLSLL